MTTKASAPRMYLPIMWVPIDRREMVRKLARGYSVWSRFSLLSIGSLFCAGSILSIGSAGSILSIGSAGSILSIGSAGGGRSRPRFRLGARPPRPRQS